MNTQNSANPTNNYGSQNNSANSVSNFAPQHMSIDIDRLHRNKNMNQSESLGKIFEALAKAQGGFPSLTKDKTATIKTKTGSDYSYGYIDLSTIIEQTKETLSANGLAITQNVQGNILVTILGHSSGEWIKSNYPLPDPAKIKPQEFGSFITYARRYSITSTLGLCADSDDDANKAQGNSYTDTTKQISQNTQPVSGEIEDYIFQKTKKFVGQKITEVDTQELTDWAQWMESKEFTGSHDYKAAKQFLVKYAGAPDTEQAPPPPEFNEAEEIPF